MRILYKYLFTFILFIPQFSFAQGLEGGGVDNDASDKITRLSISDQPVSDIIEYNGGILAHSNDTLFSYNVLLEEASPLKKIAYDAVEFVGLQTDQTDAYLFFNAFDGGVFQTAMVYNLSDNTLTDLGEVLMERSFLVSGQVYFIGKGLTDNPGLYHFDPKNFNTATDPILLEGLTFGNNYQVEVGSNGFFWIVFDKLLSDKVLYYVDTQREPAKLQNYAQPNDLSFAMINNNIYYGSQSKVFKVTEADGSLNENELVDYSTLTAEKFFKLGTDSVGFYLPSDNEVKIISSDNTISSLADFFTASSFLASNVQHVLQLSDDLVGLVNGTNEVMLVNSALEFVNNGSLFSFTNAPFYGEVFEGRYLTLYSSVPAVGDNNSDEIVYYDLVNKELLVDIDFPDYQDVGYDFRPRYESARGREYIVAYSNSNGFELNFLSAGSANGIKIAEEIENDQLSQDYLSDAGVANVLEEYSTYPRRFIELNSTLYYLAHLASGSYEGLNFMYKVNEYPSSIGLSNSSISEASSMGAEVATLSTSDADDSGGSFTYDLVVGSGDTDNDLFNISGDKLILAGTLDHESKSSLSIELESVDPHGLSITEAFALTVTDANDAPNNIELSSFSVLENLEAGAKIADISTADEDAGDNTFTYRLVDVPSDSFQISGSELLTSAIFDYSAQNEYVITLETEDASGATFQKNFTIVIIQENLAPTGINLSSAEVVENVAPSAVVGELSAVDPNEINQSFSFRLVSGNGSDDNGSFSIDSSVEPPLLKTSTVFDYETKSRYSTRLEVTDQDGASHEEAVSIMIKDVNDAPDSIALNLPSLEFSSKEPGEKISRILISDQDIQDGLSASYDLNGYDITLIGISSNDGAAFNISQSNDVYNLNAENALNFDSNSPSNNIFTLALRVEDSNHSSGEITSYSQEFTIELKNEDNAFPPTEIELSNNTLNENMEVNENGLIVGVLTTLDDNSQDAHTYTLAPVANATDLDNAIFEITEMDKLAFKSFENVSYDDDSIYRVNVRSTDETGLFTEQLFSVRIEEYIDEKAPIINTSLVNNTTMLLQESESLLFTASIEDWELDTVSYRFGGILSRGNFQERGINYKKGNQEIEIPISANDFDEFGMKIQMFATDKSGNADSSKLFYLYHELGDENRYSSLPSSNLGNGRSSTDYKMFSVPYNLDNDEIRSFLEQQLGVVYSIYDFRILNWDTQGEVYTEIPSLTSFQQGKSYWFTTTIEDAAINFGSGSIYPYKADSVFVWELEKGWNQIGNPYPVSLDWTMITEGTSLEGSRLQIYDGSFQSSEVLDPYEGAFVLANEDVNLKAKIDNTGISSQRIRKEELPFTWKVDLEVRQGEFSNKGRLGMHAEASEGLDKFDLANPPYFTNHLEINFNKEKRFYSNYKADVVNTSQTHTWDFSIDHQREGQAISLKWRSEGILPNQLWLVDMNSLVRIDMANQSQYRYTAEGKTEFKVVYNQFSSNINLGELRFGRPVPNPMTENTMIGFNLPDHSSDYILSAEMIGLSGKKVKQLHTNASFKSGYHQIEWNGTNSEGMEAATGMYIYQIRLQGKNPKVITGRVLKMQ